MHHGTFPKSRVLVPSFLILPLSSPLPRAQSEHHSAFLSSLHDSDVTRIDIDGLKMAASGFLLTYRSIVQTSSGLIHGASRRNYSRCSGDG